MRLAEELLRRCGGERPRGSGGVRAQEQQRPRSAREEGANVFFVAGSSFGLETRSVGCVFGGFGWGARVRSGINVIVVACGALGARMRGVSVREGPGRKGCARDAGAARCRQPVRRAPPSNKRRLFFLPAFEPEGSRKLLIKRNGPALEAALNVALQKTTTIGVSTLHSPARLSPSLSPRPR